MGWGFLKDLDDTLSGLGKLVKNTASDVGTLGASLYTVPAGFALDTARLNPVTRRLIDDVPVVKNLSGGGAASQAKHALGDLLASDSTLTGAPLTAFGRFYNEDYFPNVSKPFEMAGYLAAGASWQTAGDLADRYNAQQSVTLAQQAGLIDRAQRGTPKAGIPLDLEGDDPWQQYKDDISKSPGYDEFAENNGDLLWSFLDPTLGWAAKGSGLVVNAGRLANAERKWGSVAGEVLSTETKTGKHVAPEGEHVYVAPGPDPDSTTHVHWKPGILDKVGGEEARRLLRLPDTFAGRNAAGMLTSGAQQIKDPIKRIYARDLMKRVFTTGDPDALWELNKLAPEMGNRFANVIDGTTTGAVTASVSDAERATAILRGDELPTLTQPDVVDAAAAIVAPKATDKVPNSYGYMLQAFTKQRVIGTSIKGRRALARLHQEGWGRQAGGTLWTRAMGKKIDGDSPVVAALNADEDLVAKQPTTGPASGTVNQPTAMIYAPGGAQTGALYVRQGGWRKVGERALHYATGGPIAKATARLSDDLRGTHMYGELGLKDDEISTAANALQNVMRLAQVDPKIATRRLNSLVNAESTAARYQTVEAIYDDIDQAISNWSGLALPMIQTLRKNAVADGKALIASRNRQFSAASIDGVRADHAVFPGPDGVQVIAADPTPLLKTDAADSIPLLDYTRIIKWAKYDKRAAAVSNTFNRLRTPGRDHDIAAMLDRDSDFGGSLLRGTDGKPETLVQKFATSKADEYLHQSLEQFNSVWKDGTLLTRFIPYAIRNTGEEGMRVYVMGHLADVAARAIKNRKQQTLLGARRSTAADDADLIVLREEHKTLEGILKDPSTAKYVKDSQARARQYRDAIERATREGRSQDAADNAALLKALVESPDHLRLRKVRDDLTATKKRISSREFELKHAAVPESGTFEIPGVPGEHPQAYADSFWYDKVAGKAGQMDTAMAEYGKRVKGRLDDVSPVRSVQSLPAPVPESVETAHLADWALALNHQIRNDPAAMAAVQAKANGGDFDDIYNAVLGFLNSPAGRKHRLSVPGRSGNIPGWADSIATHIDTYLPTSELANMVSRGEVTMGDLRALPIETRPDVHLQSLSAELGDRVSIYNALTGSMYNFINRATVDQMSRHPMFAIFYEDNYRRRIEATQAYALRTRGEGATVSTSEMNAIANEARKDAAADMRRSFYHNDTRSTAAHRVRFLSQFFAAQQDSVRFWMTAAGEHPDRIRKLLTPIWMGEAGGSITDDKGQPVKPGTFIDKNQFFHTQGPWSFGEPFDWPVMSLLLPLQNGSVVNPGFGPLVSIPTGWFQKAWAAEDEDLSNITSFVNQFGAPNKEWQEQVLPNVVNRFQQAMRGYFNEDGDVYFDLWNDRSRDLLTDWRDTHEGRDPSKSQIDKIALEAKDQVKHMMWLRFVASAVSPVQPVPSSKHQALLHEYHNYKDIESTNGLARGWAESKFLDKYGDAFFALTKSASERRANLDATTATVAALNAQKSWITKNGIDASVLPVLVGPEGKGAYNQNAYAAIRDWKTAHGHLVNQTKDAADYLGRIEVSDGWRQYVKYMGLLRNDAIARGYLSPDQDPELKAKKDAFTSWLKGKNEMWRLDFEGFAPGAKQAKFDAMLPSLKKVAENRSLLNDPQRGDIVLLKQYLDKREQVLAVVKQRYEQGYSAGKTIEAKDNNDLRLWFAQYGNWLANQNLDFETYIFPQVVERDPLYDKNILEAAEGGVDVGQ